MTPVAGSALRAAGWAAAAAVALLAGIWVWGCGGLRTLTLRLTGPTHFPRPLVVPRAARPTGPMRTKGVPDRRILRRALPDGIPAEPEVPMAPTPLRLDASGPPDLTLPLRTVEVPGLGGRLAVLPLTIDGDGPFDFVVSTGLTTNLIPPKLQARLGIPTRPFLGRGPGGEDVVFQSAVARGVKLADLIPIVFFSATIQPLPPAMAAAGVDGVLGMELLEQCDLCFENGTVKVFGSPAGFQTAALDPAWRLVECFPLPQRLVAVQLQAAGVPRPLLAVVDTGRPQSLLNAEAAALLGVPTEGEAEVSFELHGIPGDIGMEANEDLEWRLPLPPRAGGVPFAPVRVRHSVAADAFLAAAAQSPERGLQGYAGPMALVGQDLLGQRNLWVSGNARRLLFRLDP